MSFYSLLFKFISSLHFFSEYIWLVTFLSHLDRCELSAMFFFLWRILWPLKGTKLGNSKVTDTEAAKSLFIYQLWQRWKIWSCNKVKMLRYIYLFFYVYQIDQNCKQQTKKMMFTWLCQSEIWCYMTVRCCEFWQSGHLSSPSQDTKQKKEMLILPTQAPFTASAGHDCAGAANDSASV